MAAPIRNRNINQALGRLRILSGLQFEFEPSIGILAEAIDKLGLEISHFREPLVTSIHKVMIPSFRRNFAQEGRPERWQQLQPFTVKKRLGDAHPILRRTGRLFKDATSTSTWHITDTAASIQHWPKSSWYGALHQAGYGQASKASVAKQTSKGAAQFVIPARPFIVLQDEDEIAITEVFFDWLEKKAREVGRFA